ncbi:sugar-binding domain-containing protein, partial [Rhizobium leguminosarum]|uniref:sugar-binding domain-containing protein n=1 Tax=Rhizobium leguminosarum TaxID=384 RepID=UPI003F95F41D
LRQRCRRFQRVQPCRTKQAAAGGVGEILGHFFDADGHILDTALTARKLSASLPKTKKERLVALAGGQSKVAAIRAILNSSSLF